MPLLKNIQFQSIIDALLNDDADFPENYLASFSDMEPRDFNQLLSIWNQITPERKTRLFENLELLNETDTMVDFSQIATLALSDPTAAVRASGIRMLWDYENEQHIPLLLELLRNDLDLSVRAHAAGVLGKFIYLGELEEIDEEIHKNVEDTLLEIMRSAENDLVRQKALEALGFSSREEVASLISNAYQSTDEAWLASSIFAMGRSADEKWTTQVLKMLAHPEFRIQLEAVRAAGELEIKQARNLLLKFVLDSNPDEEIWTESIWALSKIGGENVHRIFEKLLKNAETEEDEDFLQEAIANLELTNGIAGELEMMGFGEPVEDRMRQFKMEDEDIDLDDIENSWVAELEEALEEDLDEDFYGEDNDEDDDFDDEDDLFDDEDDDQLDDED